MFLFVPARLEEGNEDTKLLFLFEWLGQSVLIPSQCKAEKSARSARFAFLAIQKQVAIIHSESRTSPYLANF